MDTQAQMLKIERQAAQPRVQIKRKCSLEKLFAVDSLSSPPFSGRKCREEARGFMTKKPTDALCVISKHSGTSMRTRKSGKQRDGYKMK